jgi:hypothetical protein
MAWHLPVCTTLTRRRITLSFNRQHLFAGAKAKDDYVDQLKQGVHLDKEYYLKRFPVWFSFRGNAAIHLSHGKAATIVG